MRIVVNNIAASSGGAMSILKDFYNYIIENDNENEWIFLLGDNYLEETRNVKVITMKKVKKRWINKIIFDLFIGKKHIKRFNPDVVFSMQNIITFGLKIPQCVYIHQSIPFQNTKKFSPFKSEERILAVYQYLIGRVIKMSAKKADKVIVQTKSMKKAVCEMARIDQSKVISIYPSIDNFSNYRKNDDFNNKSFFYPTAESVYKNNECIFKANDILNQKGITDFNVKLTISSDIKFTNIDYIGRITRKQVIDQYNKSTLILPSYIESFPLPLEEARQMGTIVLASDCDFSREILNDYENAYFFNPFRPEELACLMERVLSGNITRRNIEYKFNIDFKSNRSWQAVVNEVINCKM